METREQAAQMKELSMEVFGAPNRYKKLYESKTRIQDLGNTPQYKIGTRTTEQVLEILLDFKAKREEHLLKLKKDQEAEALTLKTTEEFSGSAL